LPPRRIIATGLPQLQTAIVFDASKFKRKEPYNWQKAYLGRIGWFDKKSGTPPPEGISLAMLAHIYQSSI